MVAFPRAVACATVGACTGGWSPAPPSSGGSSGRRWGDVYRYALALTVSTDPGRAARPTPAAVRLARHVDAVGAAPVVDGPPHTWSCAGRCLDGAAPPSPPPGHAARRRSGRDRVRSGARARSAALASLSTSSKRVALVLRHYDGLLLPDVAAALGVDLSRRPSRSSQSRAGLARGPIEQLRRRCTGADPFGRLVRRRARPAGLAGRPGVGDGRRGARARLRRRRHVESWPTTRPPGGCRDAGPKATTRWVGGLRRRARSTRRHVASRPGRPERGRARRCVVGGRRARRRAGRGRAARPPATTPGRRGRRPTVRHRRRRSCRADGPADRRRPRRSDAASTSRGPRRARPAAPSRICRHRRRAGRRRPRADDVQPLNGLRRSVGPMPVRPGRRRRWPVASGRQGPARVVGAAGRTPTAPSDVLAGQRCRARCATTDAGQPEVRRRRGGSTGAG